MQPFSRAAAMIAAILTFAPSGGALAQPMPAEEFFAAGLRLADDEERLRMLVLGTEEIGPEKEAILVEDARLNLRNRAFSDLVLAAMEVKPESGDRPEDYFLAMVSAGGEIVVDGILRLPYEQQRRLLDFTRLMTKLLITENPELCAVAGADPRAPELANAEINAYAVMTADAVRDIVELSREAIAAAIEARPAPSYTEAEITEAAVALQAAVVAEGANLPLLARIDGRRRSPMSIRRTSAGLPSSSSTRSAACRSRSAACSPTRRSGASSSRWAGSIRSAAGGAG